MPIMVEIRYSSPKGIPAGYNPAKVSTKLRNIAQAVIRQHKQDLSRNYYPERQASLPGEFPRKRTGNLRKSVNYNPKSINISAVRKSKDLTIRLGYDDTICNPAKVESLRNGRGGRNPMAPRAMMPNTAMSVIPIELAKSNPEPWTTVAQWKPLTIVVLERGSSNSWQSL